MRLVYISRYSRLVLVVLRIFTRVKNPYRTYLDRILFASSRRNFRSKYQIYIFVTESRADRLRRETRYYHIFRSRRLIFEVPLFHTNIYV